MDNEFILTDEDMNLYYQSPYKLLEKSPEKLWFVRDETGKFIRDSEKDHLVNGKLVPGAEPTLVKLPMFLNSLIGKDITESKDE